MEPRRAPTTSSPSRPPGRAANPAGVVHDAIGMTGAQMLRLAAEDPATGAATAAFVVYVTAILGAADRV